MKARKLGLALLLLLYFLIFVHGFLHLSPTVTGERIPFVQLVPVLALFSLLHALFMLGWRRAVVLFAVSIIVSLGAELAGVRSGLIFGPYHYTDALGPKILGDLPYVIPFAWFMMIYPAYVITNLAVDGRPFGQADGLAHIGFLSLVAALVLTAWDLTLDPYMVEVPKAWVWEDRGPYFGIPIHNYLGWVATAFVIFALYYSLERKIPLRPHGQINRHVALLPLIIYGFMSVGDVVIGSPEATRVISPFAMGLPLLVAATRLVEWRGMSEEPRG